MCEEIPFRHQSGSLANAAHAASYANEAQRFLWAASQTNEIFSDVNTAAARRGGRWPPLLCMQRRGQRLRGRALTCMRVCVPSQKLIWAAQRCQRHLCLASLIPRRCTDSHLNLCQRRIPAHLNQRLFNSPGLQGCWLHLGHAPLLICFPSRCSLPRINHLISSRRKVRRGRRESSGYFLLVDSVLHLHSSPGGN